MDNAKCRSIKSKNTFSYSLVLSSDDTIASFLAREKSNGAAYYTNLIGESENSMEIKKLAEKLKEIASSNAVSGKYDMANFVSGFVGSEKSIAYEVTCPDNYTKMPFETVCARKGDCEDKSALFVALMEAMGYDAALVSIISSLELVRTEHAIKGHMMAALKKDEELPLRLKRLIEGATTTSRITGVTSAFKLKEIDGYYPIEVTGGSVIGGIAELFYDSSKYTNPYLIQYPAS